MISHIIMSTAYKAEDTGTYKISKCQTIQITLTEFFIRIILFSRQIFPFILWCFFKVIQVLVIMAFLCYHGRHKFGMAVIVVFHTCGITTGSCSHFDLYFGLSFQQFCQYWEYYSLFQDSIPTKMFLRNKRKKLVISLKGKKHSENFHRLYFEHYSVNFHSVRLLGRILDVVCTKV